LSKLNVKLSKKKVLLLGFLVLVIIAIPITIFLVQTQLQTRTQATPNTTLSFTPGTQSAEIAEDVQFDILMSPGNNQVNYVKLVIKYDPTKLAVNESSFTVNTASGLSILQGPVLGTDTLSVALSIGSDPTKVIQTDTNIGSIVFNVIGGSALPSDITFDPTTEIRSINGANDDAYNENVFLSGSPASVTILGGEQTAPTPTLEPSPTPEASPSASPTPEYTGLSDVPICSSIGMDVAAAGIAPYTINFTVSGTDMDGTIESVSFDFGDDNFEEITSGGGISTDTIDVTIAHTYYDPGEYIVSAILTDDTGETSNTNSCTSAVTITDEFGNTTAEENEETEETEETTTLESANELSPTLPPTGPTEVIMGMGALGAVLFVIGTLLFFAL
jgi:hypothetical protein